MNYANIKKFDIANGPGVRVSLFVSGCRRHCPGCFNKETWDFDYGNKFTIETENDIIEALSPDYIKGLSVLGGEPFEPENQAVLVPFLRKVRALYPQKDIWCYTGNSFEQEILPHMLPRLETTKEMLACLDVLVDGEFVEVKKNPELRFRGSGNQHIIEVSPSLAAGKAVLWDLKQDY